MVAAVAAGAFAAAAAGQTLQGSDPSSDVKTTPLANSQDASAAMGMGGSATTAGAPELLPVNSAVDASAEVQKLTDSASVTQARHNREAEAARKAAEEAAKPKTVKPAEGTYTSGFGARWGTSHLGIDIANAIGTPIRSVADGTVVEAGPASGFGLWVRIQHTDGTITVYGHVDSFSVSEGQKVKAGDQIARMGNRGQSTGPHLHFEVWLNGGQKVDPRPWLASRGVQLGPMTG